MKADEGRDGRGHGEAGGRGIKDFDVPAFYEAQRTRKSCPWRCHGAEDVEPSGFARNLHDTEYTGYTNRRKDVFGRSIAHDPEQSLKDAVRAWIRSKSKGAQHISTRPAAVPLNSAASETPHANETRDFFSVLRG